MTTAKRYTIVECHNDDEVWFKMKEVAHGDYVLYSDYKELERENKRLRDQHVNIPIHIEELEQKLKDSELRRADLLRTLIKSTSKVQELEYEKTELIDGIEKIKSVCKSKAVNNHLDQIFIISDIILNKHTENHDALQALKKDHPEFGEKK